MLRLLKEAVSRRALIAGACLLSAFAGLQAQGQSIDLDTPSFEEPFIPVVDPTAPDFGLLSFVNPDMSGTGWVQTGEGAGTLLSDTGVFINQTVPGVSMAITNVVGRQVAFIQVDPLADGSSLSKDFISLYQESEAVFEVGKDYRFELAVGNQSLPVTSDLAAMRIAIGYLDASGGQVGSDVFQSLTSAPIVASDLVNDGSGLLTDFGVDLLASGLTPSILGEKIAVQILIDVPTGLTVEEAANLGGGFNVDNARLSVVPEPTSLALLAVSGLLFSRRRR